MPSETSDNRSPQPRTPTTSTTARQSSTTTAASVAAAAAAAAEPLPCPRCDSTNTKFCYYNNYNLAQPRHFCKSCRRYWTQGGALRNIPVGGGTRKSSSSSKRHRTFHSSSSSAATPSSTSHSPPSSTSAATTSSALSTLTHDPEPLAVSVPLKVEGLSVGCGNSENLASGMNPELNGLYMGLGGYGSGCGYGYGFYESGLGVLGAAGGKGGVLPYHAMGLGNYLNLAAGGFGTGSTGGVPNRWQLLGEVGLCAGGGSTVASGVVAGGLVDGGGSSGDSFTWPGLAISTPGDASSK